MISALISVAVLTVLVIWSLGLYIYSRFSVLTCEKFVLSLRYESILHVFD
jgi:hypothetical protein